MKPEKINRRNQVRQVVTLENGETKIVWHEKKFNQPQYANYKSVWNMGNTSPKPNSKRQKALRAQKIQP